MDYWLVLLPFSSALIGWIGCIVAGKILVRKIYNHRTDIAEKIGERLATGFSLAGLEQQLSSPASIASVMPVVEAHIDDFLRNKLKQKMPMIGVLIGDKTVQTLKEIFLKEIEEMFPQVMSGFARNLQPQQYLENMIREKSGSITRSQVSEQLTPVLRYFRLAGLYIGFLAGLVNFCLLLLL